MRTFSAATEHDFVIEGQHSDIFWCIGMEEGNKCCHMFGLNLVSPFLCVHPPPLFYSEMSGAKAQTTVKIVLSDLKAGFFDLRHVEGKPFVLALPAYWLVFFNAMGEWFICTNKSTLKGQQVTV